MDRQQLIEAFGHLPVWGVVSTDAADSFYDALTHAQAEERARTETQEDERTARIVLDLSLL